MLLKRGSNGPEVKALQRGLNKVGAILLIDGDFGGGTQEALMDARGVLKQPGPPEADDAFQATLAAQPEPFPPLTAAGITYIARAEVSSPSAYRRSYKNPCWPSPGSGITIGIGYDLMFSNEARMRQDWGDCLAEPIVTRLCTTILKPGSAERLAAVRDIEVPLPAAIQVFLRRTLPQTLDQTRAIYPEVDGLMPPQRTALVSLIYNRGSKLTDSDSVRQDRREMRQIRDALKGGDLPAVADALDAMARLWDPVKLPGLVKRRHDEARLWRAGFEALQLA